MGTSEKRIKYEKKTENIEFFKIVTDCYSTVEMYCMSILIYLDTIIPKHNIIAKLIMNNQTIWYTFLCHQVRKNVIQN